MRIRICGSKNNIDISNSKLMSRFLRVLLAAVFFCAQQLPAINATEREEIRALYKRGLAGEKNAVEQCIAKLEKAVAAEPDNQVARVYLGSAYTLRSRDLWIGPAKLAALKRGLALMDEAVAAAPRDAKVRLVRALTEDSLPFFFGRKRMAREDFSMALAILKRNPDNLEDGDKQTLYYSAGEVAKEAGDRARARELWNAAARYPIDAALALKISAALARP